ncbi:MAG: DEAD/DEAH box helicase family protein [Betaproteobacteria bacterium]|nr:DEAD/DEAH box helicase family protein [Betaproteobacteria bacterium]
MNRQVNAIAGRLSLRPPQRRSLEILDRVTEIVPPRRGADIEAALATIKSEFPTVTDFERDFPSLCFALATGVGKTRLMGAFISYLHLAHGINNFFVLAPNLTIYNKLIADFTPNTPKYVFTGIAEFAVNSPAIITGDNYDQRDPTSGVLFGGVRVNIFNISKINTEVRGGRSPRIKRLSEYIGQSYFDYLAGLDDLVLLMDESHRYRASAGVRAINELKPILGLELTATPFVESSRGPVDFKNVIYRYPLASAMEDGFVKEPAVVTQKNFDAGQFTPDQLEKIKLEDGVRLHEATKVEIETWARQNDQRIVKPFMLVIARDTTHAGQLLQLIQSERFFEGRYKDKVIQVDSSRTGVEADEIVERLLKVEHSEEPTEIVIHVNMLKEGWDVTNLYTIVPLRAANARTLIEQSIGRGLRLPYGKRTGASAVDRLNIVAHDRFQEIVDEASKPDSVVRLKQVILDPDRDLQKTVTVVSRSALDRMLEAQPSPAMPFRNELERKIADATLKFIQKYESLPSSTRLLAEEVQRQIVQDVSQAIAPEQLELEGVTERPDVTAVVKRMTRLVVDRGIDIPRIVVVPKGDVTVGYRPFRVDVSSIRYQPVERDLLIQHLRTREQETISFGPGAQHEIRLEDYVVRGLIDFDDVSYDEHADLLYDLAGQVVAHLKSYLSEDDTRNVLVYHQKQIAAFVHAQMQANQWEKAADYDVKVTKGFTKLKESASTAKVGEPVHDFRQAVEDRSRVPQMLFGGFRRCLVEPVRFQSDTERRLSVILDRESEKWFRPAKGQFQIFYKSGADHPEYQPDFVAETGDCIYMMESKARNELGDADVLAKKEAAVKWCGLATAHATGNGGKPWKYMLVPHDAVSENMTLSGLVSQFLASC